MMDRRCRIQSALTQEPWAFLVEMIDAVRFCVSGAGTPLASGANGSAEPSSLVCSRAQGTNK